MRILIVNEFVEMGGAEMVVMEQQRLFEEAGIETKRLYFNRGTAEKIENNKYYYVPIKSKINKIIFNFAAYGKIRKILSAYSPDCIILHNVFSSPITQYFAFRNYKVIQLVHDYSVVCPTSICADKYGICEGYKKASCIRHCKYHNSKALLEIKKIQSLLLEKMKKKNVDLFISPSETLNKYLIEYGYKSICINNCFDFPKEDVSKSKNSKVRYVYFGGLTEQKGILSFLLSFTKIIQERDNILIDLYGGYVDEEYKKQVEKLLSEKIRYHGRITHDNVIKEIIEADYVIVPSMWMENFPTVILEAMALQTVVIGSDRGGIPEMLGEGRGLMFEYGNHQSIRKAIEDSLELSQEQYELMAKKASQYCMKIADKKSYIQKWFDVIK